MSRSRALHALLGICSVACVDAAVDPDDSASSAAGGPGSDDVAADGSIREGFEATSPGRVPRGWTAVGYGNRSVEVTDQLAARGERSLRIAVEAGQGPVVGMLLKSNLGPLSEKHFGRAFVRIEGPGAPEFVHFDVFEGTGSWQEQTNAVRWASTGTGVGQTRQSWSWIYNVQPSDYGEFGSEGDRSAHPVVDAWMCLEWQLDSVDQTARFWQDGAAVPYLALAESEGDRTEIPPLRSVSVGFQKFQQTGGFVVLVDEVALAPARVGCDE